MRHCHHNFRHESRPSGWLQHKRHGQPSTCVLTQNNTPGLHSVVSSMWPHPFNITPKLQRLKISKTTHQTHPDPTHPNPTPPSALVSNAESFTQPTTHNPSAHVPNVHHEVLHLLLSGRDTPPSRGARTELPRTRDTTAMFCSAYGCYVQHKNCTQRKATSLPQGYRRHASTMQLSS